MLPVIAAGVAVAGSVASYFGKRAQASRMRAETLEAVRRMKLEQGRVLGEGTAAGAASGIESDSASLRNYLDTMAAEFARERAWAQKNGLQSAADVQGAAGFGLASDFGSALFQFGGANNWWKKPALGG